MIERKAPTEAISLIGARSNLSSLDARSRQSPRLARSDDCLWAEGQKGDTAPARAEFLLRLRLSAHEHDDEGVSASG
jgi:hypothetical protein